MAPTKSGEAAARGDEGAIRDITSTNGAILSNMNLIILPKQATGEMKIILNREKIFLSSLLDTQIIDISGKLKKGSGTLQNPQKQKKE